MADIKKIIEATKIQLIILIVLGLVSVALSYMAYSSMPAITSLTEMMAFAANPMLMAASVIGFIDLVIVVWAGYVAAKKLGGSAVEGGIAGAVITVISGLITGVLNIALVFPLMEKFYNSIAELTSSMAGLGGLSMSISPVFGAVSLVFGLVIGAIIGFILGAIGGYLGRKKK